MGGVSQKGVSNSEKCLKKLRGVSKNLGVSQKQQFRTNFAQKAMDYDPLEQPVLDKFHSKATDYGPLETAN